MSNNTYLRNAGELKAFLKNIPNDATLYARGGSIAMADDEGFWSLDCLTEMDYRCDYSYLEDGYDDLYMDY